MKAPNPAYFVRIRGPRTDVVRRLPDAGAVVIGSRGADIEIDEPSLSPRHAVLHVGTRLSIEDRASRRGTRLDGRSLRPGVRHPLAVGETALLGDLHLCVVRREDVRERPRATMAAAVAAVPPPAAATAASAGVERPALVLDRSLERVAATDLGVLLLGEDGVGKGFLAEQLHARSRRAGAPLFRVHCGARSEALLERELFGSVGDDGLLDRARGATVLLDAVSELPCSLQGRLLAAIERQEEVRRDGLEPRPLDVRFIAVSHSRLDAHVTSGRFRRDLYLRLGTVRLRVPTLAERPGELRELTLAFVATTCRETGLAPPSITTEAWALLEAYAWPGNVRELQNAIRQAVLLATDGSITPAELPLQLHRIEEVGPDPVVEADADPDRGPVPLESDGRAQILEALRKCAGNQTRAARLLGISRGTLITRMESYALPRPRKRMSE